MGEIRAVAVIGAGVMGAGIAAHAANAGVDVLLVDVVRPGAADRNEVARAAIERLGKMDPAPLMGSRAVKLIRPGNIEDDLAAVGRCDWIVEAVVETPEVKRALYAKLAAVRKPQAVVSSNTSTIPLRELTAGMPAEMARHFCITHFFNPPRYMRLLEMVGGAGEAFAPLRLFLDERMGKTVVDCADTPGFIANRIGAYWVQCAMVLALEMGLEIEEADAVMGKPMGFPSTGVFGLMDLVGIDLGRHVNESLGRLLGAGDAFHAMSRHGEIFASLVAGGFTGNKGKGGFYRSARGADGKTQRSVLDLRAAAAGRLVWREAARVENGLLREARGDLRKFLESSTKYGEYAWGVLGRVLAYAASLVPEIGEDVAGIDTAMRLGYTWRFGPFELIDALGGAWVAARLEALGLRVPEILRALGEGRFYQRGDDGEMACFTRAGGYQPVRRAPGILLLEDVKRRGAAVLTGKAASVWDLGDGVLCFEMHAALRGAVRNMLDGESLGLLEKTLELVKRDYKALVLYDDDLRAQPQKVNFSQGANIGLVYLWSNIRMWGKIETSMREGQRIYQAMRYAPFPVVGAPVGMALGGGAEMLLHCAAVRAYAESYIGLVEAGVGLVPGWGGCTRLLTRWAADKQLPKGPMPAVAKVFEMISMARVSRSAAEALEMKFLRPADGITMNRDRLLGDAKALALAMATDYQPPAPPELHLPGASGRVALRMAVEGLHKRGVATEHDVNVAGVLAEVLSGGETDYQTALSEAEVMALERRAFMTLVRTRQTLARIKSIIDTGRPLRN